MNSVVELPKPWYIIQYSEARHDSIVDWMREHELEFYTPSITQCTKPKNKRKPVYHTSPAFPGYAFLRLYTKQHLRVVNFHREEGMLGLRFLKVEGQYCKLSERVIMMIKALEARWSNDLFNELNLEFNDDFEDKKYEMDYKVDDTVKITDLKSMLKGKVGICVEIRKSSRLLKINVEGVAVVMHMSKVEPLAFWAQIR